MERADESLHEVQHLPAWSELRDAARAHRYEEAVATARSGWFRLLSGPAEDAALMLESLPPTVLDQHPLLAALLGHSQVSLPARRPQGLRRLAQIETAASNTAASMPPLDRALILVGQSEIHRAHGRIQASVRAARSAHTALEGVRPVDAAEARVIAEVYSHLGLSLLLSGARHSALEAFEEGVIVSETSGASAPGSLMAALALISAADGDLVAARAYVVQAREQYPVLDPPDAGLLDTAEAVVALEAGDVEEAARRTARADGDPDGSILWVVAALAEAMTQWLSGYPGRALAHIEGAARRRGREGRTVVVRSAFAPLRAGLQLALGHPDAAMQALERDATRTADRHLGRARIELALGRRGEALAQLRSATGRPLSTRERAEAAALEAAALLRFSTSARVRTVVDHLGALLVDSGLRLPLQLLPASDFDRVRGALESAGYRDALALGRLVPLLPEMAPPLLTRRETAVLDALLRHSSQYAIAAELNVSVNTVKTQLRSVYRKLEVSTRDEAIAVAIDRHILVERE